MKCSSYVFNLVIQFADMGHRCTQLLGPIMGGFFLSLNHNLYLFYQIYDLKFIPLGCPKCPIEPLDQKLTSDTFLSFLKFVNLFLVKFFLNHLQEWELVRGYMYDGWRDRHKFEIVIQILRSRFSILGERNEYEYLRKC